MERKKDYIPALGYDWLTSFYDLTIRLTMPERQFRTKLMDFLDPKAGEEVLEFGFGTGANMVFLHYRNKSTKLTGLDIDPKVRKLAEKKLTKLGIHSPVLDLYEGGNFPYADNTFDKVFSSLVFHQLDRETKLASLREIYRILKPGGVVLIGDWGKAKTSWMRKAFYLVQLLDGFETTTDNVNGLMEVFMEEMGFRTVSEIDYINTCICTFCYYTGEKQ